jgi:hypothetical protein
MSDLDHSASSDIFHCNLSGLALLASSARAQTANFAASYESFTRLQLRSSFAQLAITFGIPSQHCS